MTVLGLLNQGSRRRVTIFFKVRDDGQLHQKFVGIAPSLKVHEALLTFHVADRYAVSGSVHSYISLLRPAVSVQGGVLREAWSRGEEG